MDEDSGSEQEVEDICNIIRRKQGDVKPNVNKIRQTMNTNGPVAGSMPSTSTGGYTQQAQSARSPTPNGDESDSDTELTLRRILDSEREPIDNVRLVVYPLAIFHRSYA